MWKNIFLLILPLVNVRGTPVHETDINKRDLRNELPSGQAGWFAPRVCPVSVDLSREGDTTKLVFHLQQSAPGYVFNSWSLLMAGEREVVNLDYDGTSLVPRSTTAQFNVQRDPCLMEYVGKSGVFHFLDTGEGSVGNECQVKANICLLNESSRVLETLHAQIHYPQFKVLSGNEAVVIMEGSNVTFDIEMNFKRGSDFVISALFYHIPTDSLVISDYFLQYSMDAPQRYDNDAEMATKFFEFQIIQEVEEETTDPDSMYHYRKKVVRVDLNTASNDVSGIVAVYGGSDKNYESVVVDSSIILLKPVMPEGRTNPLPPGKYVFRDYGGFICTPDGTARWSNGRDCRIECYVTGYQISEVKIYKVGQNGEGINNAIPSSTFHVLGFTGMANLNLGPTQSSMAGKYACEATGQNGESDRIVFPLHVDLQEMPF